jgi:cytochrome c
MTRSRLVSRRTALNVGLGATLLFGGLLGAMSPVHSQQSPPDPQKAKQIITLVEKAALLIDSKGKSVFPEFRKTGSEWRHDDIYLLVNDMKGMPLFNAAFPKLEGTDQSGLKDSNGKLINAEFEKTIQSKGSGWVGYTFPRPGQSQPSQKWTYVKAVTIDGSPGYVGAGFYPE